MSIVQYNQFGRAYLSGSESSEEEDQSAVSTNSDHPISIPESEKKDDPAAPAKKEKPSCTPLYTPDMYTLNPSPWVQDGFTILAPRDGRGMVLVQHDPDHHPKHYQSMHICAVCN